MSLQAFQSDAFQLDAFQNETAVLPEDLPRRRRQTIVVRIDNPLEEERERDRQRPGTPVWIPPPLSTEAAPQPVTAHTNMAQALREDEELLLLS